MVPNVLKSIFPYKSHFSCKNMMHIQIINTIYLFTQYIYLHNIFWMVSIKWKVLDNYDYHINVVKKNVPYKM